MLFIPQPKQKKNLLCKYYTYSKYKLYNYRTLSIYYTLTYKEQIQKKNCAFEIKSIYTFIEIFSKNQPIVKKHNIKLIEITETVHTVAI